MKSRKLVCISIGSWLLTCAGAWAQTQNPAPRADFPAGPPAAYVSAETPMGTGRFPSILRMDSGLPTHTLYHPAALDRLQGQKLPLVVWGNGACVNMGNRFRPFLSEIASHGFLVMALGPMGSAEAESTTNSRLATGSPAIGSPAEMLARVGRLPPVPAAGALPAPFTTANQFADAIDWAQAENVREGSALKGIIDLANIAVMGQSCGGVQAIDAARDPRVKTLGVWNSGLFPDPKRMWPVAAARVNKTDLAHLKVPAIFITGAPSDVAYKNADDDFERMSGVPLVRAWREKTGHSGTYRETLGGAFAPVAVAWLRWHLQGQEDAARMFKGTACGLCQQTDWHIRTKHID